MKQELERPPARRLIALHFAGERLPALLLELNVRRAKVRLVRQQEFRAGHLVALSIADLPSFPGDVVNIADDELEIEFRSALHSSVVADIKGEALHLDESRSQPRSGRH